MTFSDIPISTNVFLDANTLIYYYSADVHFGIACRVLINEINIGRLAGYTSADAVLDMCHRLMLIEAIAIFGWPVAGAVYRLQRHRSLLPTLSRHHADLASLVQIGVRILQSRPDDVFAAAKLSHQFELLSGDALIVAIMQANNITQLASNDGDFDTVPWLTRYTPV